MLTIFIWLILHLHMFWCIFMFWITQFIRQPYINHIIRETAINRNKDIYFLCINIVTYFSWLNYVILGNISFNKYTNYLSDTSLYPLISWEISHLGDARGDPHLSNSYKPMTAEEDWYNYEDFLLKINFSLEKISL